MVVLDFHDPGPEINGLASGISRVAAILKPTNQQETQDAIHQAPRSSSKGPIQGGGISLPIDGNRAIFTEWRHVGSLAGLSARRREPRPELYPSLFRPRMPA